MTLEILKRMTLLTFSIIAFSYGVAADNRPDKDLSAHKSGGTFEELDLENIPVWEKDVYKKQYKEIRDKKFLSFEGEKRRIPWLYARDGCHMRATHFNLEAERLGYTQPKRIFIFGSLEMRGAVIPYGAVQPWFHAAPIVKVDGKAMVLDPSISFSTPLDLETWVSYVAKDKSKVIYSICESGTYLPTSSCNNPKPLDMDRLEKETQLFLKFEKNILRNLGLSFN